ncbi:baseplate J/gp47 family protein [Roseibium sp. MB-4]
MKLYAPAAPDLSRLPFPDALEAIEYEALVQELIADYQTKMAAARLANPDWPVWDVGNKLTDPAVIQMEAVATVRLLDRIRVNDGIKAFLAPFAKGTNLDNLVLGQGVTRKILKEETATEPAVMQTDESLLLQYLFSFQLPAVGSTGGILYDAWDVWPALTDGTGMLDARVNGWKVHKQLGNLNRRGDQDLVLAGPNGEAPPAEILSQIRARVLSEKRMLDGMGLQVMAAKRHVYNVHQTVTVLGNGPALDLVLAEVEAAIRAAAARRMLIGAQIQPEYLTGPSFVEGVWAIEDHAPVSVEAEPYTIPVLGDVTLIPEVLP